MNLKQLSYIVTIADTQNISHAADQLYLSSCTQPLSDNFGKRTWISRLQKNTKENDSH